MRLFENNGLEIRSFLGGKYASVPECLEKVKALAFRDWSFCL